MAHLTPDHAYSLTFGQQVESDFRSEKLGDIADHGFTVDELREIKRKIIERTDFPEPELYDLTEKLGGWIKAMYPDLTNAEIKKIIAENQAALLIIRNGVNYFLNDIDNASEALLQQQHELSREPGGGKFTYDRKENRYGKITNKHARYTIVFGPKDRARVGQTGKITDKSGNQKDFFHGTIVGFDTRQIPILTILRQRLQKFLPMQGKAKGGGEAILLAEGNYYYDLAGSSPKTSTYIGWHGDTERKHVVCARLGRGQGASQPLAYQWYRGRLLAGKKGPKIGHPIKVVINHGDIYIMSEKATGWDWKTNSKAAFSLHLEHAANASIVDNPPDRLATTKKTKGSAARLSEECQAFIDRERATVKAFTRKTDQDWLKLANKCLCRRFRASDASESDGAKRLNPLTGIKNLNPEAKSGMYHKWNEYCHKIESSVVSDEDDQLIDEEDEELVDSEDEIVVDEEVVVDDEEVVVDDKEVVVDDDESTPETSEVAKQICREFTASQMQLVLDPGPITDAKRHLIRRVRPLLTPIAPTSEARVHLLTDILVKRQVIDQVTQQFTTPQVELLLKIGDKSPERQELLGSVLPILNQVATSQDARIWLLREVLYQLKYVPLPAPTVKIGNRVVDAYGYGTMSLGVMYPTDRPPKSEAVKIINGAIALGTQVFDTADTYGADGKDLHYVERLLADVHTNNPNCLVATKAGMRRINKSKMGWRFGDASPEGITKAINAAFNALGGKRPISLFQLHHTDGVKDLKATLGAVAQAVKDGKVEMIGLCNAQVKHIQEALTVVDIVSVQNPYSLYDRKAERDVIPFCAKHGIVFQPYGALGGVRSREGIRDLRTDFPQLAKLANQRGVSPQSLVLAWMRYRWPNILHITGGRSLERIRDARSAAHIAMTQDEIDFITAIRPVKR